MPDAYYELLSGANAVIDSSGRLIISSAPSRFVGWVLVFLLGVPATAWCWARGLGGNLAKGCCLGLFTVPAIALPGIAMEEITVSDFEVEVLTGMWFDPTHKVFELGDLTIARSIEVMRIKGSRYVVLTYSDGARNQIGISDLFSGNAEAVAAHLIARKRVLDAQNKPALSDRSPGSGFRR